MDPQQLPPKLRALITEMRERGHWDISRSAAYALGRSGDKRVVEALCDEVIDISTAQGYWTVREVAAEMLAKLGDPRAVGPLSFLLRNDFATVARYAAARALGDLKHASAIEYLCKALDDQGTSDYPVDFEAARSIGRIGDASGIDCLFEAARQRGWLPDSRLSRGIAMALGDIKDKKAIQPLTCLLREHPDSFVRALAAESLGKLGYAEALPSLHERKSFFRERNGGVRAAIRKAIAAISR